jgi:hypothetical protein
MGGKPGAILADGPTDVVVEQPTGASFLTTAKEYSLDGYEKSEEEDEAEGLQEGRQEGHQAQGHSEEGHQEEGYAP